MEKAALLILNLILICTFIGGATGLWSSRRRRRRCSPSNCLVSHWSSWSAKDEFGISTRTRKITRVQTCGGSCYSLIQRRNCSGIDGICCKTNCAWTWGNWGACDACGSSQGTRSRSIIITTLPSCNGTSCPSNNTETVACQLERTLVKANYYYCNQSDYISYGNDTNMCLFGGKECKIFLLSTLLIYAWSMHRQLSNVEPPQSSHCKIIVRRFLTYLIGEG